LFTLAAVTAKVPKLLADASNPNGGNCPAFFQESVLTELPMAGSDMLG
jgi:hypothetical protein